MNLFFDQHGDFVGFERVASGQDLDRVRVETAVGAYLLEDVGDRYPLAFDLYGYRFFVIFGLVGVALKAVVDLFPGFAWEEEESSPEALRQ
ncbi:MAG: hypothetical protein EOP10_02220 [Proteobacteria bacterium]|nr:MAG: hypothetical protein EOP10_02220 [Pseudomonadota bacterium]